MLHWLIPLVGNILALGGLGALAGPAGLALLLPRLLLNLKADIAWVLKRPLSQIISGALVIACVVLAIAYSAEKHHSAKLETALVKCNKARAADRTAYEQAQKDAAAKNKAQVQATEQQYKRNNDEAVANLNARLERLRSELRAQSGAPKGPAGQSRPPSADNPAGAAGEARVCIPSSQLLRGAENEERHDELITLILKQIGVDPNQ